jgi:3-deoxy-D-manno-octulosonate 8-phosphate phosphatase (KDO 8-P phosphatase)
VGIITGGDSLGMHKRFNMLGVDFIYAGSENKTPAFEEILKKTSLSEKEILYMGDDLFDLPLLERVGFSATVPTAPFELLESVHYVTAKQAGMGCAREVMEFIRLGKNKKIFS